MQHLSPKGVSPIDTKPKLGDILLCGFCGHPGVMTLTDLRSMTDEEFNALHPDERADLDFAQKACQRKLRQN